MKKIAAPLIFLLAWTANAVNAQGSGIQRVSPSAQGAAPTVAMSAPEIGATPPSPPAAAPAASAPANSAQASRRSGGNTPMPMPLPGTFMPDLVNDSIQMVAPLSVEEIKRLRLELDKRSRAVTEAMAPQGKPSTRVVRLDLSPGATPEVIRISRSEGSIVSFIDAAGRPWPIEKADSFNPTGIDIASFGANSISIASKMDQAVGNIAVRLEGMSGAMSFKVLSGHAAVREIDYSVDMQVPKYLPGVPAPVGSVVTQSSIGVDELMDYLLRTPPRSAKELKIDGLPGAMAWQTSAGRIMFRTDRLLLSPNAKRRQSSSDGMTVYDIPATPVALLSIDGRMVNVQISGYSITKEARK